MAAASRRALSHARRAGRDREARLRPPDGDAAPAPRRTEGAPPGRIEMDRNRGNLAVRGLRRSSRGGANRSGQEPPRQRRQSLGQARVQGFRRRRRTRSAQHQARAAKAAPICAGRRGRGTRPRRNDPLDRRQGLYRREAPPGAAQRGQGPPVSRRRRLDGLARRGGRTALLQRPEPVQAARALLFPQLPLRERVEEQPAPARRAHSNPRICSIPTAAITASSSSETRR